MWPNPQFPADLVTLSEKILNGKLHFFNCVSLLCYWHFLKVFPSLCSVIALLLECQKCFTPPMLYLTTVAKSAVWRILQKGYSQKQSAQSILWKSYSGKRLRHKDFHVDSAKLFTTAFSLNTCAADSVSHVHWSIKFSSQVGWS